VEPSADNAEAIEFYVRLGFRVSGFNDRLYSNEDDEPERQTVYMHLLTTDMSR
jgi:ribosomal protein S18 acetylase RimI-like enzyme